MERSVPFLNGCISFVVFVTALTLVLYMLMAFITGVYDVARIMIDTVFLEPEARQSILNSLNSDFLHNVAVLIILIKAYRILVEFMRYRHIDIKFMVEIGIISCVLELLFNYHQYSQDMRWIFLILGITFLTIYALKYETFVKAKKTSRLEMIKDS